MKDIEKLTFKEAEQEANGLREKLNYHSYRYYVLDNPEITDAEFDGMMQALKKLETIYPALVTADSPTQRVGGQAADGFERVAHPTSMFSLANTFSAEDLRVFDTRIRNSLESDEIEYVVEPKIDGLAINLVYENGVLQRGVTRGDGTLWLKQKLSNLLIPKGFIYRWLSRIILDSVSGGLRYGY